MCTPKCSISLIIRKMLKLSKSQRSHVLVCPAIYIYIYIYSIHSLFSLSPCMSGFLEYHHCKWPQSQMEPSVSRRPSCRFKSCITISCISHEVEIPSCLDDSFSTEQLVSLALLIKHAALNTNLHTIVLEIFAVKNFSAVSLAYEN